MTENVTAPERPKASEKPTTKEKLKKYHGPYKTKWLREQVKVETNKKQEQGRDYADKEDRKHVRDNCQEVMQSLHSLTKAKNLPPEATTEEFIELLNENGEAHFANIGEIVEIPHASGPSKFYRINFICFTPKSEKEEFWTDYFDYEKDKEKGTALLYKGSAFFENGPVPLLPFVYIFSEAEPS